MKPSPPFFEVVDASEEISPKVGYCGGTVVLHTQYPARVTNFLYLARAGISTSVYETLAYPWVSPFEMEA
jgi:hypothetical protein